MGALRPWRARLLSPLFPWFRPWRAHRDLGALRAVYGHVALQLFQRGGPYRRAAVRHSQPEVKQRVCLASYRCTVDLPACATMICLCHDDLPVPR